MSQFEKFKEKLEQTEFSWDSEGISAFIQDFEDGKNPLNAELKENNDEQMYDSYGNEDSILKRVFYFPEFDIFVEFSGTRQSYSGEEWNNMKEVKPNQKIITEYI
jgi:hypothetical protein